MKERKKERKKERGIKDKDILKEKYPFERNVSSSSSSSSTDERGGVFIGLTEREGERSGRT